MALTYPSSNVYLEERDLSRELAGIGALTNGAIVYVSSRGRLEPQFFSSDQEWLDFNGKPDPAISFAPYAARRFMRANAGLWAVRAIGTGYSYGGVFLQKKTATPITLIAASENDPRDNNIAWASNGGATANGQNVCYFFADGPGSYSSNISIEILSNNLLAPTGIAAQDAASATLPVGESAVGSLGAGTYSYKVSAINRVGESIASTAATVVITGTNKAVYVAMPTTPPAGVYGYKIYGRTAGTELYIATIGVGDAYYIDRGTITPAGAQVVTPTTTDEFTVNIYDSEQSANRPVESYICSLNTKVDGFGQQMFIEDRVNGYSRYIRVYANVTAFVTLPTVYSVAKTPLSSGSSGAAVTNSQIAAKWNEFADNDKYDIRLLINGGYSNPTVQNAMLSLAATRGDAFCIMDVPPNMQTPQKAVDYRNVTLNINSSRAGLYTPDVLIADEFSGKSLYIPPSGDVAAVFAFTDRATYPWFAPAGPNRGILSVEGVRNKYNQIERDLLQMNQVNYIFNAPGLGISVWEARTTQAFLSAFSFINVRRLVDNIGIAAKRAERVFLQEPNDDFTRLQIKTSLESYLEVVRQARGISNYLVVVDSRNNRPFVTANGQLVVDIIITPILPVEKIVLRISVTRQGVDLEELVANGALS